jgi:putative membrane protein
MLDFLYLLFLTLLLRPYVFIFLAVYLFAAIAQMGLARTAIFTLLAYSIAFLSEFSSTRIGFPYGFYSYIQTTKGHELWVSNVPFMDSLSYSFLSYCSLSLAIFLNRPIMRKKNNIQIHSFEKGILQKNTLFYSTLLFVLLDVIIDPVALRGSRWFLGQIYHYHDHGLYFGVPLSNFAGWIIVGFCIIYSFQFINRRFFLKSSSKTINIPYKDLLGPLLYFSVMLFNIFIAFTIDEYLIGSCGLLITGPILMLFIKKIMAGKKERTEESGYDTESLLF